MAVAANQLLKIRNPGKRRHGPVAASKKLWAGTLAYVVPASGGLTDVIATNVNKFRGVVIEEVDNSAGALGDKTAELYSDGEYFLRNQAFTFAATDVGKPLYGIDNWEASTDGTNRPRLGTISTFISASEIGFELDVQIP